MLKLNDTGGKYLCSLAFAGLLWLSNKKKEDKNNLTFLLIFSLCVILFIISLKIREEDDYLYLCQVGVILFWIGIWLFLTHLNSNNFKKNLFISFICIFFGMDMIGLSLFYNNRITRETLLGNILILFFIGFMFYKINYSKYPREEMKKLSPIFASLFTVYFCNVLH